MREILHARAFWASFITTCLVLLLLLALFAVDSTGRERSFNDTSPAFELLYNENGTAELQVNAFSIDRTFDVTGPVHVWHFIADFLCLPHGQFPPESVPLSGREG